MAKTEFCVFVLFIKNQIRVGSALPNATPESAARSDCRQRCFCRGFGGCLGHFFFFEKALESIFFNACKTPPSSLDGIVFPISFFSPSKAFSVT